MKDNWLMTAIITRPAINSQIHFHCSLRMGNEIELVNCLRGGRPSVCRNGKEMKIFDLIFFGMKHGARTNNGRIELPVWLIGLLVMSAERHRQLAKKEDEPQLISSIMNGFGGAVELSGLWAGLPAIAPLNGNKPPQTKPFFLCFFKEDKFVSELSAMEWSEFI